MSSAHIAAWSNSELLSGIEQFIDPFPEVLLIRPRQSAGEELRDPAQKAKSSQKPRGHPERASALGRLGVHRMTLIQLARELAGPLMGAKGLAPISALGLEAIAAQITHRALRGETQEPLHYFQPVAALPGFARALARTISELRLARVSPDQLRETDRCDEEHTPCADLANLLEAFTGELEAKGLIDLTGMLTLGTEAAAEKQHRWRGLPVAFLDPPMDSAAHQAFLLAVAAAAPERLLARHASIEVPDGEVPYSVVRLFGKPGAPQETTGSVLDRLRRNLFQESNIEPEPQQDGDRQPHLEIFSAPGEGLEATEIARRLLKLALEGQRFDDVAILLRNPERYQPAIEDALRRAGIPAYFSRGTKRPDPAGRAFLALLECARENLSAARFAEYLSLGQVPSRIPSKEEALERAANKWVGPEDETLSGLAADQPEPASTNGDSSNDSGSEAETQDVGPETENAAVKEGTLDAPWGWERFIVDAAVIHGADRWRTRLQGLAAEWELQLNVASRSDDETGDAQQTGGVEAIQRRLDQLRNLESFALPLIETLDGLPRAAPWSEWLAALNALAEASLRKPAGVRAVLAELVSMGEVGPVGLTEVAQVLTDRLRFLRTEPPRRRWGRVFVGSMEEARGRTFPVVFLPGLAEGLFPQRSTEDPLLLDSFRKALSAALGVRADQVTEERRRLHGAVAAAGERLIASYPRMEVAEARPRVPSFYALELPRAAYGSLPDLKQFEKAARDAAPAKLNWPAPEDRAEAIDDAEYDLAAIAEARATKQIKGAAHYLIEQHPTLARSLRMRFKRWEEQRWSDSDGLLSSHTETQDALAAHGLTARAWSPSSLELFARCPYRFALASILRLRPREAPEALEQLDPRTRGSLFHKVQDELYRDLQTAALLPVTPENLDRALEHCETVLERVADRYKADLAPAIPRVWESEIADIRTDLRGWLQHVAQNDSDWEPIEFERSFGFETTGEEQAGLLLKEGVRLRGRIDVVERHVKAGSLRVTDHKTGRKPEVIPRWVGGGKHLQPLLYGLAAAEIFGVPVDIGRLLYATQRGGYTPIEINIDTKARLFLAQLAEDINGSIQNAFLPAAPEQDACKLCDFEVVCGPYEEQRLRRKDRRDERLDALHQIRSMI